MCLFFNIDTQTCLFLKGRFLKYKEVFEIKLAEKLRLLRIEKGETQEDVSKILGIGITTLRNYENDKLERIPNTFQLKQLKEHYNVTYEYLLDDNCENKSSKNINIGKELNLSDKAIQNIKNLQITNLYDDYIETNTVIPKIFNEFLENFSRLEDFLWFLNDLQGNICFLKEVIQFIKLKDLQPSIIYYIDKKEQENLKEILIYYNEKINNILSLYQNGYTLNIDIDKDLIDDLKSNYDDFTELCTNIDYENDNIEGLVEDMFFCLSEILELSLILQSISYKEIGYLKYSISNIINDYLNNINNININTIFSSNDNNYLENTLKRLLKNNENIKSKLSDKNKLK